MHSPFLLESVNILGLTPIVCAADHLTIAAVCEIAIHKGKKVVAMQIAECCAFVVVKGKFPSG